MQGSTVAEYKLGGKESAWQGFKNQPNVQSSFDEGSFLGVPYPKNIKETGGWLGELASRPDITIPIAETVALGVVGFKSGKQNYKELQYVKQELDFEKKSCLIL